MSHFYGSLQGDRGEVTRRGNKVSGISSHVRGWDIGVRVEAQITPEGKSQCLIYQTKGSNNPHGTLIKTITEE